MSTEAVQLREAIIARMELMRRFTLISRTALPQVQPNQLPFCGVWISRENMVPDGAGNHGEARFVSDITIAVSVVRAFSKPEDLEQDVDQDFADLCARLLADPSFFGFGANSLFESIERIETRRLFPFAAETYVCELRMEITFRTRIHFEPSVPDDYRRTVMTTRPLGSEDAPAITTEIDQA